MTFHDICRAWSYNENLLLRSSRQIPDFRQLSGISVVFFTFCKNRIYYIFGTFYEFLWNFFSVVLIPQNVVFHSVVLIFFFIKLHKKYQNRNIFGFCKMLKNTTEIPDNWRKSGICWEDLFSFGKVCLKFTFPYTKIHFWFNYCHLRILLLS